MDKTTLIEIFKQSFDTNTGTSCRTCDCGKTYYNPGFTYDWEEGELQRLGDDPNAFECSVAIGCIYFEGSEYVDICDCWKGRAIQIINFIDGHDFQIANYLNEKKRISMKKAENMPTV